MKHFGGLFWFLLVIVTGIGNFAVKQTVQNLDDELTNVRRKTVAEQKEIHELWADWTYLNQPEKLADLNNRYVHLVAVSPKQVAASIDSIPLRPAPPAPLDAEPQIAAGAASPPPVAAATAPTSSPIVPAVVTVAEAAPAPPPILHAAATAPATPARPPIVHTAATVPARAASLDSIFAQVTGDR